MVPATQLKVGNIVLIKGELRRVTALNHVTPGKGRGKMFVTLKSLKTGASTEERFRSGERVELAMVETRQMDYLYKSGTAWTFMDVETYEMVEMNDELLGDDVRWLTENMRVKVQYHDGNPVGVEMPLFVEMKIAETEPPMKGATASGSPKAATLENGVVVKIPQFMRVGEVVRVDTRDNSFVERVS